MAKPILVEIDWTDARDLNEACKLGDVAAFATLVHRTTSGFLVYVDEERVVLAHDWDPPEEVGNFTIVPTGWVTKIKRANGRVIYAAQS